MRLSRPVSEAGGKSMGKVTVAVGLLLMVLGGGAYLWAGPTSETVTALAIPGGFGLVLLILGFAAITASPRANMHIMHAAVLIGLIGFVVPAAMAAPKLPALVSTGRYIRAEDGKDKTKAVV